MTVLLPALISGPPIQPIKDLKEAELLQRRVLESLKHESRGRAADDVPSYLDVCDLAYAHVRALTPLEARNKRFLIDSMPLTFTAIVAYVKEVGGDGGVAGA